MSRSVRRAGSTNFQPSNSGIPAANICRTPPCFMKPRRECFIAQERRTVRGSQPGATLGSGPPAPRPGRSKAVPGAGGEGGGGGACAERSVVSRVAGMLRAALGRRSRCCEGLWRSRCPEAAGGSARALSAASASPSPGSGGGARSGGAPPAGASNVKPLDGVKVLDLTRVLAGPFATMNLGDLGAEVIKVERPGAGDDTRAWGPPFAGTESVYFLSVNRNKKSIAINMKDSKGVKLIKELAAASDVFVENFVPGKLAEMGLGYEDIKRIAPHIVYCSITGYGQTGPVVQRGGYDSIAAAVSGLMHITGHEDGEPVRPGVAMTDLATGLYTYGAIMAGLLQRYKTGKGLHIDCNLLSTQVACLTHVAANYLNCKIEAKRWGTAHGSIVPYQDLDIHIFIFQLAHLDFLRRMNSKWNVYKMFHVAACHPAIRHPGQLGRGKLSAKDVSYYGMMRLTTVPISQMIWSYCEYRGLDLALCLAFKTKDGYIVVGAGNDHQFVTVCKILNLPEVSKDSRYKTNTLRVQNRKELIDILSTRFSEKATIEWLQLFEGSGVPYGPINNMQQVFSDPQDQKGTFQLLLLEGEFPATMKSSPVLLLLQYCTMDL
ncbi:succinate--hydroxymethylglutarate CoA-transferase isoform X5 [Motacilla alba alba]|uniref:succinate--hydroxymethylglutarate CoA-transferase isoform X5 n=1 Tax=Motacilla alba alba TaxID=1094192 RepID=UPI0018D5A824|nr:succinate--hydroxymethylglutarate CoA-transferase isoform X5 [Motacilla alba alba]